jgi:hypothetical protein
MVMYFISKKKRIKLESFSLYTPFFLDLFEMEVN